MAAITLIVTTPEFLKKHPNVVEKLLRVHLDWTDRLKGDPQKYLPQLEQGLFSLTNKKLPAGVLPQQFPRRLMLQVMPRASRIFW